MGNSLFPNNSLPDFYMIHITQHTAVNGVWNLIWKLPICINAKAHKHLIGALRLSNTKVLEDIREELQEIKLLYKELVDKLVPVEEATKEEKKAIEEKDEVADEKELMQTLG